MLSADDEVPYDVGNDPRLAEALMTPREAASAATVAKAVRTEIIAGVYDAKGRAPSRSALKDRFSISLENASVVLRMLAAEGWLSLEQGRGSFILPRRRYLAAVRLRWSGDEADAEEGFSRAADLAAAAEEGDPALEDAGLAAAGGALEIAVTVIAADAGRAAARAIALARSACREGWDLDGASVEARPADGD